MSDADEVRDEAFDDLVHAQEQYEAIIRRMKQYRDDFRDERDEAIQRYLSAGGEKDEVLPIIKSSRQWLNKLLRGEAYRRESD